MECGQCTGFLPPDYVPDSPEPGTETVTQPDPDAQTSTGTQPDPGSTCPYSLYYDVDLVGGEMDGGDVCSVLDSAECCSVCLEAPGCYAW